MHLLKDSIMNSGISGKLGALMLKSTFKDIKGRMDQSQYGGAVLLGAKSPVVKAHGASDAKTVYFTLKQIRTMVDGRMVEDFTKYWEDLSAKKAAESDSDTPQK